MPDRIPTTTTGSFPRPADLDPLLDAMAAGQPIDQDLFRKLAAAAAASAVQVQSACGIDWPGDGEMFWTSFLDASRLTGFDGPMAPWVPADMVGMPLTSLGGFAKLLDGYLLPSNTTRDISYRPARIDEVITAFRTALEGCAAAGQPFAGAFLSAPSPGCLSRLGTTSWPSKDDSGFVMAIAEAMRTEYQRITAAGFTVQLDSPDLAMCKHTDYADLTVAEFRDVARMHVAALNYATEGIPREQIRVHVCWGNYPGPHDQDIALADIIDIVYEARAGLLVLEHANPRHRHETSVLAAHPLPAGMNLAAGVIDTLSPHAEHPRIVAQELLQLAGAVGRDRLWATTDCGFATFGPAPQAPMELVRRKLTALAEGAALASEQLWP